MDTLADPGLYAPNPPLNKQYDTVFKAQLFFVSSASMPP